MSTFLLVHGAFHGAWCWHRLIPELEALGHQTRALDLPGHGVDRTDPRTVQLADYTAALVAAVDAIEGPVCLVGHSLGGFAIACAAEQRPEAVERLVFLAAFIPETGASPAAMAQATEPTLFSQNLSFRDGVMHIDPAVIETAFFADCDAAVVALARGCLVPQPAAVLRGEAVLSEAHFGAVAKSAIVCTQDETIAIADQKQMSERAGIGECIVLDSSHSPFFSQPQALATHLDAIVSST
ncbi:MAG: alpha/beta fold hydrolase [Pseudomonadota bacterium]